MSSKYKKNNLTENKELQEFVFKHKRYINGVILSETLGISQFLVSYVIAGKRKDYYNILTTAEKIIRVQL